MSPPSSQNHHTFPHPPNTNQYRPRTTIHPSPPKHPTTAGEGPGVRARGGAGPEGRNPAQPAKQPTSNPKNPNSDNIPPNIHVFPTKTHADNNPPPSPARRELCKTPGCPRSREKCPKDKGGLRGDRRQQYPSIRVVQRSLGGRGARGEGEGKGGARRSQPKTNHPNHYNPSFQSFNILPILVLKHPHPTNIHHSNHSQS